MHLFPLAKALAKWGGEGTHQGLGEGMAAVLSKGKIYLLRPEGAAAETEKY